jgi:predicted transposase YbfD/YdcC
VATFPGGGTAQKYRFIKHHQASLPVRQLCARLQVSRSGYYDWLKRQPSQRRQQDDALLLDIHRIHAASKSRYGSPKVHRALRQEGIRVGVKRVVRNYISSARLSAKELLEAGRSHWSIESQLHWQLDVGMREDDCRIRREQAGENMATIRHIAFNALRGYTSFKAGMKRKQKRASRNSAYLSQVLAGLGVRNLALPPHLLCS